MYVYYLRNLYLDNKLRERGALTMAGERIDLARVTMPAYIVASRDDHIVPWRSALPDRRSSSAATCTFVLGASGHIAGVVNPPDKKRRNYWTNAAAAGRRRRLVRARATAHPGSWWPHWGAWLARARRRLTRRRRTRRATPAIPPLEPAPGRYVREAAG